MNRKNFIICIFLMVVFSFVLLICTRYSFSAVPSFEVKVGDNVISSYYDSHNGAVYVFLPSYSRNQQILLASDSDIVVDGGKVEKESDLNEFLIGEHFVGYSKRKYPLVFLQASKNVSSMFIQTETGGVSHINSDKSISENVRMKLVDSDGCLDYQSTGWDKISGHGNTTWDYDKKPYTITLREGNSILGMSDANKYVLLANSYDYTHIRDSIAFDMIKQACESVWAPDYVYVDVYINGGYNGLYLMAVKPTSYNLKYDDDEILYEMSSNSLKEVKSNNRSSDIYETVNAQISHLNAVLKDDSDNICNIIDIESWAEKYLIDEVLLNHDGGAASQFFHMGLNDKIVYAGPAWDYDGALGENSTSRDVRVLNTLSLTGEGTIRNWYYKLYNKEAFRKSICAKYQKKFRPALTTIYNNIDCRYDEIYDSAYMNSLRWNVNLYREDEVFIKEFMMSRMKFLDSIWNDETFCQCLIELETEDYGYCTYASNRYSTINEMLVSNGLDYIIDEFNDGMYVYKDTLDTVKMDDILLSDTIICYKDIGDDI